MTDGLTMTKIAGHLKKSLHFLLYQNNSVLCPIYFAVSKFALGKYLKFCVDKLSFVFLKQFIQFGLRFQYMPLRGEHWQVEGKCVPWKKS